MANSLVKFIPLTILYTAIVIAIINFLLLEYLPIPLPGLIMFILYSLIFFTFYGYITSYYASSNKCEKTNKKRSLGHGISSWLLVSVTYIAIYFLKFLREPFSEIIGKGNLSNYIAETFYISLNLILLTISNTFQSAKLTCELKPEEIKENLKKLDKYLNKKFKKKKRTNITVKD
jgi:hypothetical protein